MTYKLHSSKTFQMVYYTVIDTEFPHFSSSEKEGIHLMQGGKD